MSGWRPLLLALVFAACPAQAHIVYGTRTLQGLVADSDLVLHARIVAADDRLPLAGEPSGQNRPQVEADVLELLKGSLATPSQAGPNRPRIRFVQHGHGVARFEPGNEALVFLQPIGRSRELAALGEAGSVDWLSVQEHHEAYALTPSVREPLLAAVRAYVAAARAATPQERTASLRRGHLALLTSGDPRLAASALRDLVVTRELALLTAEDLPVLEAVLDDPATSMGVRVALLAELEQRALVDGPPRWLALLSTPAPSRDRVTAIRAAASSADPAVRSRLLTLLGDPDPRVAAGAATAVAAPGRDAVVDPLASALEHESPRVRMAALRGLGRVATPRALQALQAAAVASPDPKIRRHAQAELRKRASR